MRKLRGRIVRRTEPRPWAEPTPPRLTVRKGSGGWSWWVTGENGRVIASNFEAGFNAWHTTHAETLAVGLAALEAATVRLAQ